MSIKIFNDLNILMDIEVDFHLLKIFSGNLKEDSPLDENDVMLISSFGFAEKRFTKDVLERAGLSTEQCPFVPSLY